jgi:hypothetical protein
MVSSPVWSRLAAVVMIILLAVGCNSEEANPSDEALAPDTTTTTVGVSPCPTSSPDPDVGIGYKEAKCRGLLFPPFEALLTRRPINDNDVASFSLRNVGDSQDTFTITVDGAGEVYPDTVTLESGEETLVTVRGFGPDSEIAVTSAGGGSERARTKVTE